MTNINEVVRSVKKNHQVWGKAPTHLKTGNSFAFRNIFILTILGLFTLSVSLFTFFGFKNVPATYN